ncbi:MAG: ABC transporter ATP-binding protein [Lachnospiraceae bacterium]|jgi:peptide/nickel transport system ATP-binding protein/oligopeptide transport system ATP-binding protein|nr:ABC transporter ATP-binding protein [Lachnospiraceae bacterium]
MNETGHLLELKNLKVRFPVRDKRAVHAVNGISLSLDAGESLGVVGESGCGKSVTFSSVMRLIKSPPAIVEGEILFNGEDILKMDTKRLQKIRGKDITMIFQEPMTSLNPVMRIGNQITETIILHEGLTPKQAENKALEYLKLVEMPDAKSRLWCYPHQLSGGLRQRVMIAMALACSPKILLADEPTTALDVTIQAQILDLLRRLQEKTQMSTVMITHDLGIIAELTQRVAVFYAGRMVEEAPTKELFEDARHPYTIGLLGCIPTLRTNERRLYVIEGNIPNPVELPSGCAFHPRCKYAKKQCEEEIPELSKITDKHKVACHFDILN